jgi:hypothetical protein
MSVYRLEFITPLFNRGAYDDRAEIRPSSIRGQLHWWHRALGGNAADEKAIYGGVHGAGSSKVVVRVSGIVGGTGQFNSLPHKSGGRASPKAAYQIGTKCDLHILTRLGGLTARLESVFNRALETWLLLGTLGFRSTRAGGSFRFEPVNPTQIAFQPPANFSTYEDRCKELLNGSPLRFALLDKIYSQAEEARRVVSDTLGGHEDYQGQDDLARLNDPLGKIKGQRKTSPLRFRIVCFGREFRVAAVWDGRLTVTGNRSSDLAGLIRLLSDRKPALGLQLQSSELAS